uniref:NXPE family member 3-like n=1 Tax=Saccoglossus kowalevskii TaxID=10224 RepID=A0ABM0M7G7_SACKO|nr:PREDICTED: NXPE family member 3-like [Saccoglossus kowalevskii]
MSSDSLNKSTAGRVVDYGNGTYSVYFFAAWAGDAYVHIGLRFNREGVLFLENVIKNKEKLITYTANYTNGSVIDIRPCALVNEDAQTLPPVLQSCAADLPVPLSDGYWKDRSVFVSFVCKSQQWTKQQISTCLADKKLILCGDSTLMQIEHSLTPIRGIDIVSHFVYPRVGNVVVRFKNGVLESDLLDRIVQPNCSSSNFVIVLNFAFHYGAFTNRAYLERIYHARLAVQRLMLRCPTSKIVIKLLHPRDNIFIEQSIHSANWVFYDMNRIIRRVFGGIGVHFLDIWDMVLSSFENKTVHMPPTVIVQEVHLMLSYICPEMVT